LIPASPRTPATCAAGQVTTIVQKAKLTPALLVRAVPIKTGSSVAKPEGTSS
jgi:hypothetical protein